MRLTLRARASAVTITVNSNDDAAASTLCNLRDAIKAINNGNSVTVPTCVGIHTSASLTLRNSILSANSAMIAGNASLMLDARIKAGVFGAASSLLGSALNGPNSGNGNVFTDAPGLGPLANNGGATQTMALLTGSLAIDAGSNALAVNAASQPLQTDQTGFSRIRNGVVDIGAFEFPGDHIFGDGFEP